MNIQQPTFWGFYFTDCVHESAPEILSVHLTKAAAWRAMRTALWDFWEAEMRPVETHVHLSWKRGYRLSRTRAHLARRLQRYEVKAVPVYGLDHVLAQLAGAVNRTDAMVVSAEVDNDDERLDHHHDARRLARYHARRGAANELNRELRGVYEALTGRDPWADIPL